MFSLGPFCGNLLSAVTLKLPEKIADAGGLNIISSAMSDDCITRMLFNLRQTIIAYI